MWDNDGNVLAITRLLQAYLKKPQGVELVCNPQQFTGLLGIFQKLNASRKSDHEGLALLGSIFDFVSLEALQQYMPTILQLVFSRLQNKPANKFKQGVISCFARFFVRHHLGAIASIFDKMQVGFESMFDPTETVFVNVHDGIRVFSFLKKASPSPLPPALPRRACSTCSWRRSGATTSRWCLAP